MASSFPWEAADIQLVTSSWPSTEQNRTVAACATLITILMNTTFVMAADESMRHLVWHLVLKTFMTKP